MSQAHATVGPALGSAAARMARPEPRLANSSGSTTNASAGRGGLVYVGGGPSQVVVARVAADLLHCRDAHERTLPNDDGSVVGPDAERLPQTLRDRPDDADLAGQIADLADRHFGLLMVGRVVAVGRAHDIGRNAETRDEAAEAPAS